MTPTPHTPRRVRPLVRYLAIAACIVLLPIAAHSLWDYVETGRLVRELAAIRASGEPITEREAGSGPAKATPDQQSAGRYFMAAALLASPLSTERQAALNSLYAHAQGDTASGTSIGAVTSELVLTERDETALSLADKGTALPFLGFPAGTEYSYRTAELHRLTQLMSARTVGACIQGEADAASRSAISAIRTRVVEDFFRRADYQVPALLSFCRPSSEVLLQVLQELQAQDQPDAITNSAMRDRAAFIDRVVQIAYGANSGMPELIRPRWTGFFEALWRPMFTRRLVAVLRGWNELVVASRLPWPEKGTSMRAIYDRFAPEKSTRPEWSPAPRWNPNAMSRSLLVMLPRRDENRLVLDRAAAAAIAVELYRRDHEGALPPALQTLVPAYLTSLPQDPATGRPMLLKSAPDAFSIYSVGRDGQDDGGDFTSERPRLRGKDVGVRVLLNLPATSLRNQTVR